MTDFTDFILDKKQEGISDRKFLQGLGIDQQKFNKWKDGAMPDDKVIAKICEEFGLDFLYMYSLAKTSGKGGRGASSKSNAEWKKIFNQKKKELSIG